VLELPVRGFYNKEVGIKWALKKAIALKKRGMTPTNMRISGILSTAQSINCHDII
jgi:hypothetical protein